MESQGERNPPHYYTTTIYSAPTRSLGEVVPSKRDKGETGEVKTHRLYHLQRASPSATLNGINNNLNRARRASSRSRAHMAGVRDSRRVSESNQRL